MRHAAPERIPVAAAPERIPVAPGEELSAMGTTVPTVSAPLGWQVRGLSFTPSGYGRRIPTTKMIQLPGSPRWRRVYVCIYSNAGTAYVDGPRDPATGKRPVLMFADPRIANRKENP